MHPFLHIGSFTLPTYGLMLSLGIMTAMFVMDRAIKRAHLDADAVGMVATAGLAGIVGSKIWYLLLDSPGDFHALGWHALYESIGFSWFGALLFGVLALVLQGRREKIGGLRTLDLAAPACAIGQGYRAHRVFSFRRWLLRHCDSAGPSAWLYFSPVGNGVPERDCAGLRSRLPDAAL